MSYILQEPTTDLKGAIKDLTATPKELTLVTSILIKHGFVRTVDILPYVRSRGLLPPRKARTNLPRYSYHRTTKLWKIWPKISVQEYVARWVDQAMH
jgi:hypothetical protein